MYRLVITLSLAGLVASALPAAAGPNASAPAYGMPVARPFTHGRIVVPGGREKTPDALLGDTSEETEAVRKHRPGVTGKYPTRTFQRRPSEGK